MAKKNYQQLAEQIIPLVGGKENIKAVRHCQTRLRFTLAMGKDIGAYDGSGGAYGESSGNYYREW